MIQPDTIQALNDSVHALPDSLVKLDSLARIDSLARMDSIHAVADSLKALALIPKGFLGTPHPSLPQTEGWVFGILLLLFFLLIYSISRSTGLIAETVKSFLEVKERSSIFSKATVNDFRLRFLLTMFSIGVFSLFAYLLMFHSDTTFSIKTYGFVLVSTSVFVGLKSLLFDLMGYVFLSPSTSKMGKEGYFNILSLLGVSLFPFLILRIYVPTHLYDITEIISLVLCVGAAILVIIKLFQIYFHKIVASFYILLYLCTLEILPLIVLYRVYSLII